MSHRCARTPSTPAYWPGCLKPAPAALSQVSGLDMAVLGQRWRCRLQWTGRRGWSPSYSKWHIDIWALKQFCSSESPKCLLRNLKSERQARQYAHSPCCLLHSPRILCLTLWDHCTNHASLSASTAKCPWMSTH